MKPALLTALALFSINGFAEPQLTPQGCHTYSVFVLRVAEARDAGKTMQDQLEKLERFIVLHPNGPLATDKDLKEMFAVQIRYVFDNPEQQAEELAGNALASCVRNEGRLGLLS
jgi:hypothetical protein